jgi:hypothetical protein
MRVFPRGSLVSRKGRALRVLEGLRRGKIIASNQEAAGKSPHPKCQRCWNYWPSVGTDPEYPDICERCASVVRGIQHDDA